MKNTRTAMLLAGVVLAAGIAATSATAGTTECKSIKNCIDVIGPWVVVPAHQDATFLLACPKKHPGTIGGVDSQATSADVRVTFDGLLGGPVGAGTTTAGAAYFRGLSAGGKTGAFQPRIGCIPSSSGGRQTTSARKPVNPGSALVLTATTVKIVSGEVQTAQVHCPHATRFVSSWDATAFQTVEPPDVGLAAGIRVKRTDAKAASSVMVTTSETLPAGAHAEVQVGVVCAG